MSGLDSRRFILDRIRVALDVTEDGTRSQARLRDWCAIPRLYRQTRALEQPDRIRLFKERLSHYNAGVHTSSGDVPSDIRQILSAHAKRVLIVPPGFPDQWLPSGFMFIPDENLSNQQLSSSDGVITGCTLAIALTGTIVLESSPQQGRRAATLIPDYHLCVVRKEDIVEFVPEAIRKLEAMKHRPLTFVSGPSATVDIEMTRVRGVHGPRTLDVLIA
ncbi:MAG: LUD domain-containing protein [Acidobacteriaceae bacterium]|nr:LUD domain-containing protein [Acidobacteriaceae bacterium]